MEVLQGPWLGLHPTGRTVPLTDSALELTDARAFSQSLGLTAKATASIPPRRSTCRDDRAGIFLLNTLLGKSRWWASCSARSAVAGCSRQSYAPRGPLADPNVSVNPLAALTPGFLRGLFGLF